MHVTQFECSAPLPKWDFYWWFNHKTTLFGVWSVSRQINRKYEIWKYTQIRHVCIHNNIYIPNMCNYACDDKMSNRQYHSKFRSMCDEKQIHSYVDTYTGLRGHAQCNRKYELCCAWDRAASGGMVPMDSVVMACNKPLLMTRRYMGYTRHII